MNNPVQPIDIFTLFVQTYVDRDSQSRWLSLAKRNNALFKKRNQFASCLNAQCTHVDDWNGGGQHLLPTLVAQFGTTWVF